MLTNSMPKLGQQFDGETHLCINMNGLTPLGRFLATPAYVLLNTEYGDFESIEGYYRYLLYRECCKISGVDVTEILSSIDQFKTTSGLAAVKLNATIKAQLRKIDRLILQCEPTDEIALCIQRAIIQKLKSNTQFMGAALENQLPLVNYYATKDRLVTDERFQWYPKQVENAIYLMRELYQ